MTFTKPFIVVFCLLFFCHVVSGQNLTIYRSSKDVPATVEKIVEVIKRNEALIFFETVSHDEIAKARSLEIPPTRSILFEDPNLSTALISCQQTTALDLPLEIIVWEENEDVYVGFMDPKYLVKRFMISGCEDTIESLTRLMVKVTMDALREL